MILGFHVSMILQFRGFVLLWCHGFVTCWNQIFLSDLSVLPSTPSHLIYSHHVLDILCGVMIFSERELTFTFAICYRRSVCL